MKKPRPILSWEYLRTILSLILVSIICLSATQKSPAQTDDTRITDLVQKVLAKAKRTKGTIFSKLLSEYQYTSRVTIESEATHTKSEWVYEWYCLNDGLSHCKKLLLEKNGKPLSQKAIQKSRERIAKDLISNNENEVFANIELSYGLSFGYQGVGKSVWIDPSFYLRDCQILSSDDKTIKGRDTVLLRLGDCDIESESWKIWISFMPKTEAEIWVDKQDECVTEMKVYAKKEPVSSSDQNVPVFTLENTRVPEGYWLFIKATLDTSNKALFPNVEYKWKYEFFDYKHLQVEVNEDNSSRPAQ